jgi:hypothetical protein
MPENNESALGVSIAQQCNTIKDVLNDICSQEKGICVVADSMDEKVLVGFNSVVGPRVLIVFVGADPMGGDDVSELIGRERRYFDIMVQRGKILSGPTQGGGLVSTIGPSKPFYDLLEIIRDAARSIVWPSPMVQNPTEYHGVKPSQSEGWLMDSYVINISTIVDIGRIQVEAPQIQYGPMVQLQDPEGIQFNKISG